MLLTIGRPSLRFETKSVTFTGAATLGQAGTNTSWFTVTGQVLVAYIIPYCTVDLTEALATATITLGTTTQTALLIAATNSVDIDANEVWTAAAPATRSLAIPATLKDVAINDSIVSACAVQNTTGGAIRVDCYWLPLSAGATLVAA